MALKRVAGEAGKIKAILTPSHLCNNLAVHDAYAAFVHCNTVVIVERRAGRAVSSELRVHPPAVPTQAAWCRLGDAVFLVVTTTVDVQVWDRQGTVLLHAHRLAPQVNEQGAGEGKSGGAGASRGVFARGIAAIDGAHAQLIYIGTSTGMMLAFSHHVECGKSLFSPLNFGVDGSDAGFGQHEAPVTALATDDVCATLISADDTGRVVFWHVLDGEGVNQRVLSVLHVFDGAGGQPCTSLQLGSQFVIAAFSTGHIRLWDRHETQMVAVIAAHNRCINALASLEHDGADGCTFASVADDTVLSVWSATAAGDTKVELVSSVASDDSLLVGVAFQGLDHLVTSAFEAPALQVWQRAGR